MCLGSRVMALLPLPRLWPTLLELSLLWKLSLVFTELRPRNDVPFFFFFFFFEESLPARDFAVDAEFLDIFFFVFFTGFLDFFTLDVAVDGTDVCANSCWFSILDAFSYSPGVCSVSSASTKPPAKLIIQN